MPEGDGEETVCHIQKEKADFGDIFAKVLLILLKSLADIDRSLTPKFHFVSHRSM